MANATIAAKTKEIFKTYGGSETNTGSIEGQIALLTEQKYEGYAQLIKRFDLRVY